MFRFLRELRLGRWARDWCPGCTWIPKICKKDTELRLPGLAEIIFIPKIGFLTCSSKKDLIC